MKGERGEYVPGERLDVSDGLSALGEQRQAAVPKIVEADGEARPLEERLEVAVDLVPSVEVLLLSSGEHSPTCDELTVIGGTVHSLQDDQGEEAGTSVSDWLAALGVTRKPTTYPLPGLPISASLCAVQSSHVPVESGRRCSPPRGRPGETCENVSDHESKM